MVGGKVVAIDLPPGKDLPAVPPTGLNSTDDARRLRVVVEIDTAGKVIFAPGPNPSIYAYARTTVQRKSLSDSPQLTRDRHPLRDIAQTEVALSVISWEADIRA